MNLPAAQAFVNFLTSPALQAQLKTYLPTADSGGPPFVADASPIIAAKLPATYKAGKPATITGTLTNAETGYPALVDKPVTIDRVVNNLPVPLAKAYTDTNGAFTITFVPPVTGSYELTTSQISQLEDTTLTPAFGDLLSPAATTPATITVHSAVTKLFAKSRGGMSVVYGAVAPSTGHVKGVVAVLAKGVKGGFRKVATQRLASSAGNFAIGVKAKPGNWQYKVTYADPHQVAGATSKTIKVSVGAKPASSVKLGSVKASGAKVTVNATVNPKAPKSGGQSRAARVQDHRRLALGSARSPRPRSRARRRPRCTASWPRRTPGCWSSPTCRRASRRATRRSRRSPSRRSPGPRRFARAT